MHIKACSLRVVVHIIHVHVYTWLGSLCFALHNDCRTRMIYDVCRMLVSPIDIFFKSQDFSTDTHFTAILTKCLTTFLDVITPSKVCLSLSECLLIIVVTVCAQNLKQCVMVTFFNLPELSVLSPVIIILVILYLHNQSRIHMHVFCCM